MLHVEGDLIYEMGESLRNTVIIDPQWLCGDVLAALAAPPSWKGEDQLRQVYVGDDGVVTLEAIRTRFPDFDPHKMMTLLEVRRNAAGRPMYLRCHGSLLLIWRTPHLLTTPAIWLVLSENRRWGRGRGRGPYCDAALVFSCTRPSVPWVVEEAMERQAYGAGTSLCLFQSRD